MPLRRILVLALERRVEIPFLQLHGQPTTARRSRRKTHPAESKALARSILNMILDSFCDNPPWKIPYYHLNQSNLVIEQ
jgi:hypothetical protein